MNELTLVIGAIAPSFRFFFIVMTLGFRGEN